MFKDGKVPMMMNGEIPVSPKKIVGPPSCFENAAINMLESDENAQEICALVYEKLNEIGPLSPVLSQLAALKIFNRFVLAVDKSNIRFDDIQEELRELVEEEEVLSSPDNMMPTIGTELEVPITKEVMKLRDIFSNFNITHGDEGEVLYEVSSAFSYGARVQAMLLQELAKIGFVPMEGDDSNRHRYNAENLSGYKIDHSDPLSLHVNIGVACFSEYRDADKFLDEIEIMNDALVLAYTSSNRVRSKKTNVAVDNNKNAERSTKTATGNSKCIIPIRIELKSAEFRDSSVYRLLYESQILGEAFSCYVMSAKRAEQDEMQKQLALEFESFIVDCQKLFRAYGLSPGTIFDNYDCRKKVARLLEESEVASKFRHLLGEYRRKIVAIGGN